MAGFEPSTYGRFWVSTEGGTAPIVEHPEVSTARALIRALRRTGDGAGAERLARRVACTGTGLVAWLAQLAQVEAGLGDDGGREAAAAGDPLFRAGLALQRLYPPAAVFHRRLIATLASSEQQVGVGAIERALDAVYY